MKEVDWKKISQFPGPEQTPGFLLWQASTQWRRQIAAALSRLNLTHPQFVLLASIGWLTREGAEISQVELAHHCSTDINMTSQILRTLKKKGHIERCQRKGDARSKLPRLTSQGAKLVEQAIPMIEEVDEQFFCKIAKEKCVDILKQLVEHKT